MKVVIDELQVVPEAPPGALGLSGHTVIPESVATSELGAQGSPDAAPARLFGVYPALVTDVKDSGGQGRVRIRLPWLGETSGRYEPWARLATLMAGNNRGTWFVPEVEDEVLVAFQGGDVRHPFVIGALWNGRDAPPASMDAAGSNDRKVIRSRSGIEISIDDRDGQESFSVSTPGGQRLALKDSDGAVEIADSHGNRVELRSGEVSVTGAASVKVSASTVKVTAGMLDVTAAMSRFSGVVRCDSLVTNSVVSASYTPGAGNVW
jgi:uncharacterized protein involved in type VI secretion and phage assembly